MEVTIFVCLIKNYLGFIMKKTLISLACMAATMTVSAQEADSTVFKGYLYNKEFDVYMRINFYDADVIISWQEVYGALPGYLSKSDNNYCWIVTEASVNGKTALLEMVNDSGSDDLTATLTQENDSVYTLRHRSGSVMKVPEKGKWKKLPSTLTFQRRKTKK